MATVNSEQSAENMEYVRRLLKQKQPGFSAALESTVDLVDGSWSHRHAARHQRYQASIRRLIRGPAVMMFPSPD